MKSTEQSQKYFTQKFNCSQSVFATFAPRLGLTVNDSLKVASAFGAGMGRQQKTCGAVTGALMALGLKYGKGIDGNEDSKLQTYARTKLLFDKFIEMYGSANCRELLDGLDMSNSDDMVCIQKEKMFETRCPKYVAGATQIVEEIFENE
ncbi:C-GCAxxG-C-C family protein [Marinilabilia salmonicolor]|jgi:C_GCAxxG_C_C family probable redox protein|uniref:C_GCAxxG_C_C family probable redox protein n=1 Tax=Marinilabilia salmonicolor TaxID=989 RepID=A0A368VCT3_9BACT|nr:C-GCAxxG-C-C family protein [Marinilabilia salmonicolor]RCW38922.1 C_GCAxxG_C_C family probable redox protein [Marinilabilia salmonicolor]